MPVIQFARFDKGILELFRDDLLKLEYIAISHVWGTVEWLSIPGVEGEVYSSQQKALFIEKILPQLVGSTPFWMDILTVDQRDRAAVIGVVQHIPSIYRGALKTIAVRESDGLYGCCADAVAGATEWTEMAQGLATHSRNHMFQVYRESYLERLWTLQECLLSDTVQFVECVPGKTADEAASPFEDDGDNYGIDPYSSDANVSRILNSLYSLAYSFGATVNSIDMRQIFDFIKAYVGLDTVSRRPIVGPVKDPIDTFDKEFYLMHSNSNRRASMSRDYIFSVMTQFKWYQPPRNAKDLDFNELFTNLYNQARISEHPFTPRITQSMTKASTLPEFAWSPSTDQPEPRCLGDLLKLLGHRALPSDAIHFTDGVTATGVDGLLMPQVLKLISRSMSFSNMMWREAHRGGTLSQFGSLPKFSSGAEFEVYKYSQREASPKTKAHIDSLIATEEAERSRDTWLRPNALMTLSLMWCGTDTREPNLAMRADWRYVKRQLLEQDRPGLRSLMIYYAAMVSCQVPLLAVEWAQTHFVPVVVKYERVEVLGLLSREFTTSTVPEPQSQGQRSGWTLMSVGRHVDKENVGTDLVLVDFVTKAAVGLLPDFLQFMRTNEEYVERMGMLYRFGEQTGVKDFSWRLIQLHEVRLAK